MRFEVPQFIEIEDKIVGPFTWKQFIYLGGGVGIAVVLFFTTNIFVFAIFGVPLAGLAALLAFYPINNRPFSVFLESVVAFLKKSRLYLWKKDNQSVYRDDTHTNTQSFSTQHQSKTISSLSRKLELEALKKNE